jgi:hypothetical protein
MGVLDALKYFARSVDREYDRRVKAASLVRGYDPTGASHQHGHQLGHDEHDTNVERLQGEGGATGELQSSAGPQLHGEPVGSEASHT